MIGEQWAIGDLAECIEGDDWHDEDSGAVIDGPAQGDVLRVSGIEDAGSHLCFAPWPIDAYAASAFRKLPPADTAADAKWTAEIKLLGQRVFA